MRVCGVELTANDAVICLLHKEGQLFDLPDCRVRKLSLPKGHSREDLQKFQFDFKKLMEDYKVDHVAIKERMTKGKFAGGAVSFKLEAAIQLIDGVNVKVVSPSQIKSVQSDYPLPIMFEETGLKVFQQAAFNVAYTAHHIDLSVDQVYSQVKSNPYQSED